jgi:putative ABC transport system substrate-binding protein
VNRRDLLTAVGMAVVSPAAARAQQKRVPVIGFLGSGEADHARPVLAGFRQGLSETGYVEGQNLAIEYRWAEGRYDQLPALPTDLVGRNVDLIAAFGGTSAHAAKAATVTIPIVFSIGIDPVATGLVVSLARPGGNITGVSVLYTEMLPKRFEFLTELVPQARIIALLVNPRNPNVERMVAGAEEVAHGKAVKMTVLKAGTEGEVETAFASLGRLQVGALVVGTDAFFSSYREQLGALALRHAIPAIYEFPQFATSGGLVSYAPSLSPPRSSRALSPPSCRCSNRPNSSW